MLSCVGRGTRLRCASSPTGSNSSSASFCRCASEGVKLAGGEQQDKHGGVWRSEGGLVCWVDRRVVLMPERAKSPVWKRELEWRGGQELHRARQVQF